MKYLAILLLLALPDSLKIDTVQQNKVHKQAQQMNKGIEDLSIKFDSLLILLKNDTLRKKN